MILFSLEKFTYSLPYILKTTFRFSSCYNIYETLGFSVISYEKERDEQIVLSENRLELVVIF